MKSRSTYTAQLISPGFVSLLLLLLTMFFFVSGPNTLFAEESGGEGVRGGNAGSNGEEAQRSTTVAVTNLRSIGEITKDSAQTLSELLRAKIEEFPNFELLERQEIKEITKENMRKLSGGIEESGEFGELAAAEHLIIGSVGKLFGNVVISVRLVGTETGRIVAAETVYIKESELQENFEGKLEPKLTNLSRKLGTKAMEANRDISISEIEKEMEEKRYERAKKYLDIYLQNEGLTDKARRLRERLIPLLADRYAKEADGLRKEKKYDEALEQVQEALALRLNEEYLRLRDKINREQREYRKQQELERKREAQRREEREARREKIIEEGRLYPLVNYINELSVHGFHIAPASYWEIEKDLDIPTSLGEPGAEILGVGDPFRSDGRGRSVLNNLSYIGSNVTYIDTDPYSRVLISGYLSPYLSIGVKLANIGLLLGLDGGGTFEYNNDLSAGYRVRVNGGASAGVFLKIKRTTGLFALLKVDYQYYLDDASLSHPAIRLAAGLVF